MPPASTPVTEPRTMPAPYLAGTYAVMAAASPLAGITIGSGTTPPAGHLNMAEPSTAESLTAAEERTITEAYGVVPRRDVAATWAFQRYLFTACLAMSGPWYLERRVPVVPLRSTAWARHERGLLVDVEGVSCLPGDPVAGTAGVHAVATEEQLRAALRAEVAAHVAPVVDAFRPLVRRGHRVLWGMVTDQLANGLWHLGRSLGDGPAGARAADALLPGSAAPFADAAGFRPSDEPGGEPTRTRTSCCLYYTIRPDELCATCPRDARC